MNITLNIQVDSLAELQYAIAGLAGIVGGAVTTLPAAQEEKPKRASRPTTKPEKQPDLEPVKEPETTDESTESTDSEETDQSDDQEYTPTVVELRAKAQEKGKTPEGKKAIKALLEEFGSKSISDIPEEKRAAFLARLEEL